MDSQQQNGGIVTDVMDFWRHPFNTSGDAFTWVLFVGLLVIAAFLWNLVLIEILREV